MQENSAEKTELPTPKRLREAREKGQVALSRDVVSTILLIGLTFLCGWSLIRIGSDFRDLLMVIATVQAEDFGIALQQVGFKALRMFGLHTALFCGGAILLAVVSTLAQVGFLFTFTPLKPSFERISPSSGLRRICSLHNVFEFFKNLIKTLFLSYLVFRLIESALTVLPSTCYGSVYTLLPLLKTLFKQLAFYTIFGCALIAVADWFFQRRRHMKELMMTKSEVKREHKEMEVSAEVRRARSEFAQELLNQPLLREGVRRSSVIVTNPTHIAMGLRYVKGETPLPQITVAGADHVAAVIRAIASEEGVPMMENVPLARALYAQTAVEDYIPETLIVPVAEMLKWLQELNTAQKEVDDLADIEL